MRKHLVIYKKEGVSPLSAVQSLRVRNPEYKTVKIGYAGRLDPMAEGLLLLLFGDENKKKVMYENLEKEYVVDVLCGIKTDSYDILGRVQEVTWPLVTKEDFGRVIASFIGEIEQRYPPFSSPKIKGKSLFALAREGKLSQEMIPVKRRTIKDIQVLSVKTSKAEHILPAVTRRISEVEGDFRQEECIHIWNEKLGDVDIEFPIFTIKVTCSFGTYMRSLADEIGEKLGVGALAYTIRRTRIGPYTSPDV